ncbi:ALP1-like protein [Tanacetum coccineum]
MLLDHLLIFQTLTNGAKRKLDHLLLHLVNELLWKTNDESGTPRSQSGWKTFRAKKDDKEDQCASRVEDYLNTNQCAVDGDLRFILKLDHLVYLVNGLLWKTNDESGTPPSQSGWKTSWAKKDDKEDQCESRKTNDESGTPRSQSGWKTSWAKKDDKEDQCCCGKLMMRVGPLVLSLDGKLLGPRRMTKKINVHPEWKTWNEMALIVLKHGTGNLAGVIKKYPTIMHEAVVSYDLRIWHAFFGVAGVNNDLTVLNHSLLFDGLLDDIAPVVPFEVNGVTFEKSYYLADGIYPQWAAFVKSFTVARDERNAVFKRRQESARKDVERAFGVLQSR